MGVIFTDRAKKKEDVKTSSAIVWHCLLMLKPETCICNFQNSYCFIRDRSQRVRVLMVPLPFLAITEIPLASASGKM